MAWGDDDGGDKKKGCFKCGEEGHMSRDCPSAGGGGDYDSSCRKCKQAADCEMPDVCRKCNEEGHMARDCPTGEPDKCFKCKQEGHRANDCELPDKCRNCGEEGHQPQVCKRCGEEGHMVRECSQEEKTRQLDPDEDGKIREIYVPKEEDEEKLYENGISSVQVTGENKVPAIPSFARAGLHQILMDNINKSGYTMATPIQKHCIPIIMAGRDVMACAQTGSGKTAAFLIPIIHKIIEGGKDSGAGANTQAPQCIVITPTRELAIQIKDEARKLAMGSMVKSVVAYGDYEGTSVGYQLGQLVKGCHILIATPERLLDFVDKGRVSLENLKFLVLDEAERMHMLDMGFIPEIQLLMHYCSPNMPAKEKRQTLIFSATFPDEIQESAAELLNDYLFVVVDMVGGVCKDVKQEFYEVLKYEKREKLKEILQSCNPKDKTLVFVKTKENADFIATHLSEEGFPTTSFHDNRLQREREEALYDFRTGKMAILVATAARGLDIKGVAHVINYDMPDEVDEYVHRIGRTVRVGNTGKVTSFYDGDMAFGVAGEIVRILAEVGQTVPDWLMSAAVEDDDEEWG